MSTTTETDPSKSVRGIIATGVATVLATVICGWLKLDATLTASIVATATGAAGLLALRIGNSHRSKEQQVAAAASGLIPRPLALVVAVTASGFLLAESAIAAVFGSVVGLASDSMESFWVVMPFVSLYVVAPLTLVAAFFIAKRASHYIVSRPPLWLAVATAVFLVLRIILIAVTAGSGAFGLGSVDQTALIGGELLLAVVIYGVAVLGWWSSTRRHLEFVAARLFRLLSDGDKDAALALLHGAATASLPSTGDTVGERTGPMP